MINLYNAQIEELFIHRVGNKNKGEDLTLSELPLPLDDERRSLLKEYFLKPFRKANEDYYSFFHDTDLEFNAVYDSVRSIFSDPESLHESSKAIARHLYGESSHPHIRSGELYVAYLRNIQLDNNKVNAIVIVKSEIKSDFMLFEEGEDRLEMILQQGISLDRIDKAALIIDNGRPEDGFQLLTIDKNKYDAKYWIDDFLGIEVFEDENYQTKKYLQFNSSFAKEVINPAEGKLSEISFNNRSVNYFAKNDEFNESTYLNEVINDAALIAEYKNYKVEKGPKYNVNDTHSQFEVADKVVTEARKKIKNSIKLDTGIEIKVKITNPDKFDEYIEKGYDEDRGMYYYLTYFNQEEK